MNKLCSSCHQQLPPTFFHANRAQSDGLANECKDCRKTYQTKWRNERREEVRLSGVPLTLLKQNMQLEPCPISDLENCWIWTGRLHEGGYGIISYRGVEVRVHLGAWTGIYGPKPENLDLDHLCRRRNCFNIKHLELTTRKENLNRGIGNKGSINGQAKLNEDEVREIKRRLKVQNGKGGSLLAWEYNVSPMTISNIKHGIIWSHIQ